jgi:hypothetical protein
LPIANEAKPVVLAKPVPPKPPAPPADPDADGADAGATAEASEPPPEDNTEEQPATLSGLPQHVLLLEAGNDALLRTRAQVAKRTEAGTERVLLLLFAPVLILVTVGRMRVDFRVAADLFERETLPSKTAAEV